MIDWLSLIIAIIALVLVIVLMVILFTQKNLAVNGIPFQIQSGAATSASDVVITGGNNLYIVSAQAPSGFLLTIANNKNNKSGTTFWILNLSGNSVTISPSSGTAYSGSTTLNANALGIFSFLSNTSIQRLQ